MYWHIDNFNKFLAKEIKKPEDHVRFLISIILQIPLAVLFHLLFRRASSL